MKGVFVQTAKLIRKRTCILPAVILAAMRGHSRTCLNKLRAAPLLRALASLHIFAHRPAAAAPAVLRSLARCLFILTVIISHSQTCMNKLRIAPRSGAPAMLHTFAPRPAAAASASLRCSVLMCGRSQMSARPDMRAYPSLRPLARCLFILAAACLLTSCGPEPGEQDYENSLFGEGRPSAGMTAENSTGQESLKDRPAKEGSGKDKSTGSGSSSSGADSGGSRGAAEQEQTDSVVGQEKLKEMDADELAALEDYLNERSSYGFLHSTYEEPADIDLNQVFYTGAGFKQKKLEKKEKELLFDRISIKDTNLPVVKVTEEQIDDLLTRKAGITYEDSNRKLDTAGTWAHIGRYKAWYSVHSDSNQMYIKCSDAWTGGDKCIVHYELTDDLPAYMAPSEEKDGGQGSSEDAGDAPKKADAEDPEKNSGDASGKAHGEDSEKNSGDASEKADGEDPEKNSGDASEKADGKEQEKEAGEEKASSAKTTKEKTPESEESSEDSAEKTGAGTKKSAHYRPVYEAMLKKTEDGWQFCSNILWVQKDLIEAQSYRAELAPLGEVFFAPVYPDTSTDPKADVSFTLVQDVGLLAVLEDMEEDNIRSDRIFKGVEAVDFTDYNKDGFTDILTVCTYTKVGEDGRRGGELTEARVYEGRKDGAPELKKKKTRQVNNDVETLNISNITAYLTGKTDGKDKKYKSWKEAYADHIRNLDEEEYDGFALIHMNDDRVPELVQVGATSAKGTTVVVYKGGTLNETWLNRRNFLYLEYENLLLSASGVENLHYDSIYSITGGKLRLSVQGYYGNDSFARVQYDEKGREVYYYIWDGGRVSASGYRDGISFIFDTSRAKSSGEEQLLSAEELLEKLE